MAETCLQVELAENKAELQRLREWVSIGKPTVYKYMSLIYLVPR